MKLLGKNIHWFIGTFLVLILGMHIWLATKGTHISLKLTLIHSLTNITCLALAAWCVVLLIRAYPTKVAILYYAFVIAIFFAALNVTAQWLLFTYVVGNDNIDYKTWIKQTFPVRVVIDSLLILWLSTYLALKKRVNELEDKFLKQADASTLLREAELFKLRQQLQPHFLYNSLNSISALIMIQPDKAQEMIGKLSDFLRSSVKREAQDVIPIAEELNYIESYLAIESVRFGDRLCVNFEKEYTDDATVPPFLVQPILENAIKYGLYGRTGKVTITMHIALQNAMLEIRVSNPYDDAQTQSSKGTGFGLEGIRRRLYLLYARTDLLETQKTEQEFTTILKIPQAHV